VSGRPRTTAPHKRSFDCAPRVRQDEMVRRLRDDEKNPGWFFGVATGGPGGYFPSRWFEVDPGGVSARALRDYDGMELTIEADVEVELRDLLPRNVLAELAWPPASSSFSGASPDGPACGRRAGCDGRRQSVRFVRDRSPYFARRNVAP
jgi:hypothetical protein